MATITLALAATAAWAQDGSDGDAAKDGSGDLDVLFDAEMIEDDSGDGSAAAAGASTGSDLDALFDSDVVETAVTGVDTSSAGAPEETLLTRAGVDWGGSFRYAPEVELGFPGYDALAAALRGDDEAERALRLAGEIGRRVGDQAAATKLTIGA